MRRFTVVILFGLTLWMVGVGAVSWFAYEAIRHSGSVEVQVDDGYQQVHLALPAFFPSFVLDRALWAKSMRPLGVHHEAEDWGPAVLAAVRDLEAYPHVPLLEIDDGNERVRIVKRGERVVLEVIGRHESVRVVMPMRTLRRALERYES